MTHSCPICGAVAGPVRYRLPDHSVFTCAACDQIYLWPLLSAEQVRAVYQQLYETGEGPLPELRDYFALSYNDAASNPLMQLYERWLDAIERHHRPGRLLDIGCSTGLFLVAARRRGWDPVGVDDSEEATRYARQRFALDVHTADFSTFAGANTGPFDVITMWDVIEHARQPVDLLSTVRQSLADGGVLVLATPNQRNILEMLARPMYRVSGGYLTAPLKKLYVPLHFLYFTPETLERVLVRTGFEVVHITRELTDLRRFTLRPIVRIGLQALFRVASWTGLENRLFAVARVARP